MLELKVMAVLFFKLTPKNTKTQFFNYSHQSTVNAQIKIFKFIAKKVNS